MFLADRMKLEPQRQSLARPQTNAPVNICVYKVTDASGDLWPAFPDTKLWQIQVAPPPTMIILMQQGNEKIGAGFRIGGP